MSPRVRIKVGEQNPFSRRSKPVATQTNLPFSWDEVDKHSDLGRLGLVLDALPDTDIIRALGAMRKNGRKRIPRVRNVDFLPFIKQNLYTYSGFVFFKETSSSFEFLHQAASA